MGFLDKRCINYGETSAKTRDTSVLASGCVWLLLGLAILAVIFLH